MCFQPALSYAQVSDGKARTQSEGFGSSCEERERSVQMICVTVEIHEGALRHRVQISATSIERALTIAGDGMPDRRVRLLFPIVSEAFFVPGDHARREAA
jgi:hypothetical protein